MKSRFLVLFNLILIASMLLASCGEVTQTPAPTVSGEEPIYLAIIWHQHQPVYYKNPETGVYAKPWVRLHAAKDYVDMATTVKAYPNVHVTFNLTPSLISQLDDFANGAKDLYWVTAEIPADQLTQDQKQFILDRFFDTNRKIIARFPRYQELLQKRDAGEAYTTQDFLDLQVLFNLAWTDPDWLAQDPLAGLVAKGANYFEEDKKTVFAEHLRLIKEVIPVHKEMQESGQIEVTMTPYAHPILPLLVSTDLAKIAMPTVTLPAKKFTYGQDAVAQIELGVKLYQDHFNRPPRGMWPAEGSVTQEIVGMVSNAGIQWMASDEGVLAASLGMSGFTRNTKDTVNEADALYRPYYVQGAQGAPVAMVFRDVVISDKVGFTYSGLSGELAAKDFIQRIHDIRQALIQSGSKGPHLVSVILDGENAWENYENDGKKFLTSLYEGLSNDPLIKTVTPSEFLTIAPDQPKIEKLWAGSWINHDFSTWIGEDEENRAWEALATVREVLQKYENGTRQTTPEALEKARNYIYIAEGSDWFWWYGSDQNSGNDEAFDQQFRDTLKQVYIALGEDAPAFLSVPIIPLQPVSANVASSGLIQPTVDGKVEPGEWDTAGVYQAAGGAMANSAPFFQDLAYGFDSQSLYLKVTAAEGYPVAKGESHIEVYLTAPGGGDAASFSRNGTLLGFPANRLVDLQMADGVLTAASLLTACVENSWGDPMDLKQAAQGENGFELGIPLEQLGNAETGDRISLRAIHSEAVNVSGKDTQVDTDQIPGTGPALLAVPDLGTMTTVLDITDAEKDDYGSGSYTYPTDDVFGAGCFDILSFQVGYDTENIVIKFTLRGPLENPWNSSNGLSVQTFDIYIDKDGDGQGGNAFLPGRNLGLQEGFAWDYAITAEGWESGIFKSGTSGPEKVASSSDFSIVADPGQKKVTIRIPKAILGDNPEQWHFAAMVLGQEGYPSGGVMRVRDVNAKAEQWRFGGGGADSNHTRVIDLVWPQAGKQEEWLSAYTPSQALQTELTVANFARVVMLSVAK